MVKKHKSCLILNNDYSPLLVLNWKRAICLDILGKEIPEEGITVIKYYQDDTVKSAGGLELPVPAVAVTKRYIKRKRGVPLKKRSLYIRDDKMCQYCGRELPYDNATIDHVKPKSSFKNSQDSQTWNNLVIACFKCNSKKADRALDQCGMTLLNKPIEPSVEKIYSALHLMSKIPLEWEAYLW